MQRLSPANAPGLSRADIIAKIKNRGLTLKQLAENNDLSPAAISVCLSRPWPKVERIIADAIGIPADQIWPPRYATEGVPIKRGTGVKSKRRKVGETLLNNRSGRAAPHKFGTSRGGRQA